jgi:hypothetical protein
MQGGGALVEGVTPVGFGGVQQVTKAGDSRLHMVTSDHGVNFRDGAIRVLQDLDTALAMAASNTGCFGQGRCGADDTAASRLFQFLCSFVKVLVDGTPDEFRHRSAGLVGQLLQLL